jgi:hypothetical protein
MAILLTYSLPPVTFTPAWQMLDCCRPLDDVKREGITLTHAACLSRCNGAHVDLYRFGEFSLEDLRRHVSTIFSQRFLVEKKYSGEEIFQQYQYLEIGSVKYHLVILLHYNAAA